MGIKGLSALLLDDDPALRAVASRVLTSVGMHVFEAADFASAMKQVEKNSPHMIFTDLDLGAEGSGFDFLRELKSRSDFRQIPVIVLSSSTDKASVERAEQEGAADYLYKPFSSALFLQSVRQHLRDIEFAVAEFSGEEYTARIEVPCKITAASPDMIQLESSLKLEPGHWLRLVGKLCEEIGLGDRFPLRVENGSGMAKARGFPSELHFRGLLVSQKEILEEVIARWHTS